MNFRHRIFSTLAVVIAACTLPAAGPAQGVFAPAIQVSTALPSGTSGVVEDFDGDGNPDALCEGAGAAGSELWLFRGDGLGGFLPPVVSAFTNPAWAPYTEPTVLVGAADVNQDGLLDALTETWACCSPLPLVPFGVRLHLQTAGGTFISQPLATNVLLPNPKSVVLDDLDGDGTTELVLIAWNGPLQTYQLVVHSIPPATLQFPVAWSMNLPDTGSLAAGDFDGDGRKDVAYVVGNVGVTSVSVLRQLPGLSFAPVGTFGLVAGGINACGGSCRFLVAADVNADGLEDLVVAGSAAPFAYGTLPGNAATMLGPVQAAIAPTAFIGSQARGVIADFDLDGLGELAVDGRLLRASPPWVSASSLPHAVLAGSPSVLGAGDLDGDGDLDIVLHDVETVITPTSITILFGLGTARNDTLLAPACLGVPAAALPFVLGTPAPGNAACVAGLSGLVPGALAVFGLSLGQGSLALGTCTLGLGTAPGQLILPMGSLGIVVAGAAGNATLGLPVPNIAGISGAVLFAQWMAQAPAGPIALGGSTWALSGLRRIVIW